jgi:hypothetical protein
MEAVAPQYHTTIHEETGSLDQRHMLGLKVGHVNCRIATRKDAVGTTHLVIEERKRKMWQRGSSQDTYGNRDCETVTFLTEPTIEAAAK